MNRAREPFYEDLGRRVAAFRVKLGISQQALGAVMTPKLTRASIANIENGKQRVLAHTFVELAARLGCDLATLAGQRRAARSPVRAKRRAEQSPQAKRLRTRHVPVGRG